MFDLEDKNDFGLLVMLYRLCHLHRPVHITF